jgi:hypothetical protein
MIFIICPFPLYLGKLLGCISLLSYFRYKPGQVYLEKDVILPYVPNVDLCDHKCVLETQFKRSILLFFRGRLKRNAVSLLVALPRFLLFCIYACKLPLLQISLTLTKFIKKSSIVYNMKLVSLNLPYAVCLDSAFSGIVGVNIFFFI